MDVDHVDEVIIGLAGGTDVVLAGGKEVRLDWEDQSPVV